MPKISIIIPVYNVEKYLRECLDSCINQTLKDIEIICVDDASPDNSIKILEEYQSKDPRIKILRHEVNKNLGAARNTGLANATGEYIWFVDSDDYIDTKACEILYYAIKEFGVDMLCFSAIRLEENAPHRFFYDQYFHKGIESDKIYYPKTNWKEIKFTNMNVTAWAYLTKKSVIEKFRFREGVWYEDIDFTTILLASVNSFCYISYPAYFRRINNNSITQTPISQKKVEDFIRALEALYKFISENRIKNYHFLYHTFIVEICKISNALPSYTGSTPYNLKTLTFLQEKHHRELTAYKKQLIPKKPSIFKKYSLKRFIGKVWKKIRGNHNV